jgi:hypothetical protein
MASRARIEVQNQHGEWRYFTSVTVLGSNVSRALDRALSSPMGRESGRARAVDEDTDMVIDIA